MSAPLGFDIHLGPAMLAMDDRAWGGDDPPGVVYFYAPGRAGENAETFLTGFDGILQIDVYPGYNRLIKPSRKGGDPIRVAHCWAHADLAPVSPDSQAVAV